MNKTYKKYYIILIFVMLLFIGLYTILNVFFYGSVIQINVPILSFIIIIPIFLGVKYNRYSKRMLILLSSLLSIVIIWTLILLPKYTYDEAVLIISKEDQPIKIQIIRNTNTANFFYSGDYYIETKNHVYAFNFKTGNYKIID